MNYQLRNTLVLLILLSALTGCKTNSPATAEQAAAMLLDNPDYPEQYLVWLRGEDGRFTSNWITGNANSANLRASREGMVLPTETGNWELAQENRLVPLCDCGAWEAVDMQGDCPASGRTQEISIPFLSNTETAERRELFSTPPLPEDAHALADIRFDSTVLAAVGPYLFSRHERLAVRCGDSVSWTASYDTLNAETGEIEDLFTEEDKTFLQRNEKMDAVAEMNANAETLVDASDVTLVTVEPFFMNGMGFGISYHFTTGAGASTGGDNWNAFTHTVVVQARQVPEKLRPYVVVPQGLRSLVFADDSLKMGGWTPLVEDATLETRLQQLFAPELNTVQ